MNQNKYLTISYFLILSIASSFNTAHAVFDCKNKEMKNQMDNLLKLNLEQLLMVEISVASKTGQTTSEAPSSVTVFSRQEILETGIHSLEELLNFVPGFQTFHAGITGKSYMVAGRGQSTAPTSYNILFLLDGQRLNDDATGGALLLNRLISLANVKQVEVIRGPGSALYGTSAFTGVVNIVTETGLSEAYAGAGNLDGRKFYANLSHAGECSKVSLFASHYSDDGDIYGSDFTHMVNPAEDSTRDPYQADEFYLTWEWDKKLRVNARYMQNHADDFTSFSTVANGLNKAKNRHNFINFSYQLFDSEQWGLAVSGGYAEMKWKSQLKRASSPFLGGSDSEQTESNIGLEGHYHFSNGHQLLAGLLVRHLDLKKHFLLSNKPSNGGELVRTIPLAELSVRKVFGIYLQDQYQINTRLSMTLGLRYDHYSDFGGTANPRAALSWSPDADNTFKLMYGEAFRAPSKVQLGTDSNLDSGNPDLYPETIQTFELAWQKQYSKGHTGITWFHSHTKNRIGYILDKNTISGTRFNNDSQTLTTGGFELEAGLEIDRFRLRATYTLLTDTEENPRHVSDQALTLIANYTYRDWNLNLSGYHFSDMEQFGLDTAKRPVYRILDGYQVWHSAVRYTLNKKFTLTARVNNLFDKDYAHPVGGIVFPDGIPNRGRSYLVGMEMQF